MHAVVVKVTVNDARRLEELQEQVIPRVKQMPGFMTGYWTRSEGQGLSMVIFESEENARQAADQVQANIPQAMRSRFRALTCVKLSLRRNKIELALLAELALCALRTEERELRRLVVGEVGLPAILVRQQPDRAALRRIEE